MLLMLKMIKYCLCNFYKYPNPGEFWMPKSMFVLKRLYESRSGSLSVLAHVLAIGNKESLRKKMHGSGDIPAGGSDFNPVANIKTSSRDTAACFSTRQRADINFANICVNQCRNSSLAKSKNSLEGFPIL